MIQLSTRLVIAALAIVMAAGAFPRDVAAAGRIVAVVEDQMISTGDLEDRVALALASSGLANTPDNRQRLRPQVLRLYIDETLERLEAKRLDLHASVDEVQRTLSNIAQRNSMSIDQLDAFLRDHDSDILTLKRQVETQILWAKVVARQLQPRVRIGPDQVDLAIKEAERARNEPQWLLAEITLPVPTPEQEDAVRQDAQELADTIDKGAAFPALAREFSASPSAQFGGDLGWVQPTTVSEETRAVVADMKVGDVAGPVRTNAGWQLFLLRAMRAPGEDSKVVAPPPPPPPAPARAAIPPKRVRLAQVVLPISQDAKDAEKKKVVAEAVALQGKLKSCAAVKREAAKTGDEFGGDLGWLDVKDLPDVLRNLVSNIADNRLSPPLTGPAGIQMIMVCEREGGQFARAAEPPRPAQETPPPPPLPSLERSAVQQRLESQQLDRLAERYLRDLRRDAYVDLRV